MPGLLRSRRIQEKAASVGFDWREPAPIISKVYEELDEVKDAIDKKEQEQIEMELGDLMFAVVNLSRFTKLIQRVLLKKVLINSFIVLIKLKNILRMPVDQLKSQI